MFGEFSYFSVCRVCGQRRHSTELQIPLARVTYWTFNRDEPTAVSKFLISRELVKQHEHEWVFGHGRGNGCSASGPALMMSSRLASEDNVRFLDILLKFGRKAEAEKWAQRVTDPRYRGAFPFMPDRELLSDKDFDSWWTANMEFCEP